MSVHHGKLQCFGHSPCHGVGWISYRGHLGNAFCLCRRDDGSDAEHVFAIVATVRPTSIWDCFVVLPKCMAPTRSRGISRLDSKEVSQGVTVAV